MQGKWKGNEEELEAFAKLPLKPSQTNTVPSPPTAKAETAFAMSDAEVSVLEYN